MSGYQEKNTVFYKETHTYTHLEETEQASEPHVVEILKHYVVYQKPLYFKDAYRLKVNKWKKIYLLTLIRKKKKSSSSYFNSDRADSMQGNYQG